jgi:hypothetical protein
MIAGLRISVTPFSRHAFCIMRNGACEGRFRKRKRRYDGRLAFVSDPARGDGKAEKLWLNCNALARMAFATRHLLWPAAVGRSSLAGRAARVDLHLG